MSAFFPSLLASIRYRPLTSIIACSTALGTGYYLPIYYAQYQRRADQALNTSTFTPFQLIAKHTVSPSSSIFVLRPPPSTSGSSQLAEIWGSNSLWSVQAKQPQLQIGREYTPIPPTTVLDSRSSPTEDTSADIHLLIRKEKNGEMTTYLHRLTAPESVINLRGPYHDVEIPSHVDEVLFLAGGTGISPALQVAQIMARRPGGKVTILWANRRRDECVLAPVCKSSTAGRSWWRSIIGSGKSPASTPQRQEDVKQSSADKGLMVQIIEEMQARAPSGNLRVEFFIDEEDSFIKHTDVRQILSRSESDSTAAQRNPSFITTSQSIQPSSSAVAAAAAAEAAATTRESAISTKSPATGAKLILVSGPNGFVDYWAGKKRVGQDGMEIQGPLGGALGEMELNGWKVWKL